MNIRIKTLGELLDDLITTRLKKRHLNKDVELQQEVASREEALLGVLRGIEPKSGVVDYYEELKVVNRKCWNSQEVIYRLGEKKENYNTMRLIKIAAVNAQKFNKYRNDLIREINRLQYGEPSVLAKTYE